jgi:hypothetical protein
LLPTESINLSSAISEINQTSWVCVLVSQRVDYEVARRCAKVSINEYPDRLEFSFGGMLVKGNMDFLIFLYDLNDIFVMHYMR